VGTVLIQKEHVERDHGIEKFIPQSAVKEIFKRLMDYRVGLEEPVPNPSSRSCQHHRSNSNNNNQIDMRR
jgi:hypothetical protein